MAPSNTIPLELLSPAANADVGMAAIDHGADAVYIGAPQFSARKSAGNSIPDIEKLVKYAHLFRARVYVALNTILSDDEIEAARAIIQQVFEAGADGLIIQDTGLLETDLPPIPLIASTQMNNTIPEKVKFLEDVGFSRVILARELTLQEIREIRKQTTVELESFVHGALCVCYSGQCYMSQAAFGRSGNRGECAQPCRLKYTLKDDRQKEIVRDKHLLSLKDLNLIKSIPDLVDAGITSFKIEGRLKDAAYVKNVTAAYRQAIDHFLESHDGYAGAGSGRVAFHFKPDPGRTFNRGYTDYFLYGKRENEKQGAVDTPKSIGTFIGPVTHVKKEYFRMAGTRLNNGDGMCFTTRKGEFKGFRVNRYQDGRVFPNQMDGISVGTKLYRNLDHEFIKILNKPSADRRIQITMTFHQTDTDITLSAKDEDGFAASLTEPLPYEAARQPEKMVETLTSQLTSTGDTIFTCTSLNLPEKSPGFIPVGKLNALRREVTSQLTTERTRGYASQKRAFTPNDVPYPQKDLDYRGNVFNRLARKFYERHGVTVSEPAFEETPPKASKRLMSTRYCIRRQLDACLKVRHQQQKIKGPLTLSDGTRTYRLEFDCKKCEMVILSE